MARTFLLDGTALAYRAHFAFTGRGDGLTTADGHPTSATYGFTLTLRALLKREKPERIACSFDGPTKDLERTKIFADYKATREKAPDELLVQLDDVRAVVESYGIPIYEVAGQEADDVIGTLAMRCKEHGDEVFIVTADKDFMQLVDDDKVRLYDLMQRGSSAPKIVGPEQVQEKFGVRPDQIVDLLALMGDSSDNVPGVKGVGAKTAAKLLNEHDTLDAVLDAAESMKKSKLKENLLASREIAELSRDLVRIRTDLDIEFDADKLSCSEPDAAKLGALFARLEFRAFAEEFGHSAPQAGAAQGDGPELHGDSMAIDYRCVDSLESCRALARRLSELDEYCVAAITERRAIDKPGANKDSELPLGEAKNGLLLSQDAEHRDELVGLAFGLRPGKAWFVPLMLSDGEAWLDCFADVLAGDKPRKIGFNLKHTIKVLAQRGLDLGGAHFDVELASYCIAPGVRRHDLASQAAHLLELEREPQKALTGTGRKAIALAEVDLERLGPWACQTADFALRLRDPLAAELEATDVAPLFRELEMPLLEVLARMELRGIRIDRDAMHKIDEELIARIDERAAEIQEIAGHEFNIGSNQQLGEVLFGELELPKLLKRRAPKKTATGQWATDAATLERFRGHEIVDKVLEWRRLTKLKSTYVDALPLLVHESSGRIHTTYNQAVAATGRLSSEDPNLQNIPIRTEDGRQLRGVFTAGQDGWSLISADYSQIELRILAHVSEDENLQKGFEKGQDVHARTASIVFGVLPGAVDTQMRSQAKVVNYGLVYGMGVQRLANETGLSTKEAREFIDAYFKAMPRVKGWLDGTLEHAHAEGEVRTIFGRRRPLPELDSRVPHIRAGADNMAVNTPIQGSAADIIKRAMLRLDAMIRDEGLEGRMLLQVHDELVVECPDAEVDRMRELVREAMEGAAELAVPLEVELGVGKTWLEAH